jgi:hypothetical protein
MYFLFFLSGCATKLNKKGAAYSGKWYEYSDQATRWSSPENPNGQKGKGAMENFGAKGHASYPLEAGGSLDLLNIREQGVINRIWITVSDRSPQLLRSLKLEMFWDNEEKPAVSAPLGDFFGVGLGQMARFHNALFSDPEGRSFNCYIPMPFRKGARITLTNESGQRVSHVFFDIDYQLTRQWQPTDLYFHAYWHRDTATTPGRDFELLPPVEGKGRFLGVNVGINANPLYKDLWWGEGEVKMHLDGDKDYPTLAGTGTEDYIGTAWGQGLFFTDYTGCLIADGKNLQWAYYRYHIPDPVFFKSACRVTIQQLGGGPSAQVWELQKQKIILLPTTIDDGQKYQGLYRKEHPAQLENTPPTAGWTNFYRSDDVSATAYFYLNSPSDPLPVLQPVAIRTFHLTGTR